MKGSSASSSSSQPNKRASARALHRERGRETDSVSVERIDRVALGAAAGPPDFRHLGAERALPGAEVKSGNCPA